MNGQQPRPVAFMVMPFRKRPVPNPPQDCPKEVDFDKLWDDALKPALEDLGYRAIRADIEVGGVILKDMLERLAFADLVLADLSIPNGNVYYEVGIRHVAEKTKCVLIAAAWSTQLFDVSQMRSLRYPLQDGNVPAASAAEIRKLLVEKIPPMRDSKTPFHELVGSREKAATFQEQVEIISAFQAEVRAARMAPEGGRVAKVTELLSHFTGPALEIPEVALELLTLVRDTLKWQKVLDFIATLPPSMQKVGVVKEQSLLATAKLGDDLSAIPQLEELITLRGDSPERRGLIGGRYKNLWRKARKSREERGEPEPDRDEKRYLNFAIESYRKGFELDLNEYFCLCNLPGLLRARNRTGDREEADFLDRLTVRVAELKIKNCQDDGWARATILGAKFRVANVAEVERLVEEVVQEGPAVWQVETTLADIDDTLAAMERSETRQQLEKLRDELAELVPK